RPPNQKIRGRSMNSARRKLGNEVAEVRAGVLRSQERSRISLFAPPRSPSRTSSRLAVVAELHGRLRSSDEWSACRYWREPHQAGLSGCHHRRVFRFATLLHLEECRHTTHAPGNFRTLSCGLW